MTTQSTPPPAGGAPATGFLSKMVRFVSNPTKDWKELDSLGQAESGPEEDVNAQELRERIERKRRNDFIRKEEFAHWRKIINARKKRQPQAQVSPSVLAKLAANKNASEEARAQPSTTLGSRLGTLKKINEIEEQISKQWWQQGRRQGAAHAPSDLQEEETEFLFASDSLFFADMVARQVRQARRYLQDPQAEQLPQDPAQQQACRQMAAKLQRMDEVLAFFELQEEFVHQADLEEASILFASNRVAEAEKILVDVIRKHVNDPPQEQVDIWMALFDLYRAVGAQDRFDAVALDFARRFDRSAPVWFSLPEQLGTELAQQRESKRPFSWTSAAEVSVQTVAAASALRQRAASPYQFNWSRLKNIQPDAVASLVQLIGELASLQGVVQFTGGDVLLNLVQERTVANDASVARDWWLLRLALHRLMNEAEQFELAALDYTITYEESPPAWVPPKAQYRDGSAQPDAAAGAAAAVAGEESAHLDMQKSRLQGRIEDDATALLDEAVEALPAGAPLDIDCGKLIAMDFSAAGSVLNWAAQQQSEGRVVVFSNLHRLVAVFFNVIGINEHARVLPRKN
ncbi:MAG: STAS domain-containing protein [Comamonadaceae bacterium]|nr:STAS domain-containing protein [Comamonadaceae bacterium]